MTIKIIIERPFHIQSYPATPEHIERNRRAKAIQREIDERAQREADRKVAEEAARKISR
jgi:hypothetical protein